MQAAARTALRARCAPAPAAPMRVMMRMFATTYGESVISTPQRASGESIGPMQYGMTYIVRPRMQPANNASIFACASAGAIQWLFGPASSRSLRADEGQVLDARDVVRMRAVQPAVRVCFAELSGNSVPSRFHAARPAPRSRCRCHRTNGSRSGWVRARHVHDPLVQRGQLAAHRGVLDFKGNCAVMRGPRQACGIRNCSGASGISVDIMCST